MQHLLFILVLLVTTIFISCQGEISLQEEKIKLLQIDEDFSRVSVDSGVAEAFHQFLDKDCLMLSAGSEPLTGREKIYERMKERAGAYTLSWKPQRAEVAAAGDMGWTWGKYVLEFVDKDSNKQKSYGKYVNIWKKQSDGQWKVLVDIGNESPPPENP
jgi:ketosteroid isomerase-like protein